MWEKHEVLHSGWALVRGTVLVFCCCDEYQREENLEGRKVCFGWPCQGLAPHYGGEGTEEQLALC